MAFLEDSLPCLLLRNNSNEYERKGTVKLFQDTVAWEQCRNHAKGSVNRHFTTQDASIKLTRLYPSMQLGCGTNRGRQVIMTHREKRIWNAAKNRREIVEARLSRRDLMKLGLLTSTG